MFLLFLCAGQDALATYCTGNITLTRQSQVDLFPILYPDCDSVLQLEIEGLDIRNLQGLSSLVYVRYLRIRNTSVTSMQGLNNLKKVDVGFKLESNKSLVSLSGLESFVSVRDFVIDNNNELVTFKELSKFIIIKSIYIINNDRIKSVDISLLNDTLSRIVIVNNDLLENIDSLRNVKHVSELRLESNPELSSLLGLSSLISITDEFVFSANDKIVNLDNLNNLNFVGDLRITHSKLKNLTGIKNLKKANSFFSFHNNELVSLTGLEGLDTLSSITLMNNPVLKDLKGIGNVKYLNSLLVSSCDSLLDMDGLGGLEYCGGLSIKYNLSLKTLFGLNKDIDVNYVQINYNPVLQCCYVAKLILDNNPDSEYNSITNNDSGCNSIPEVMILTPTTTCCVSTTSTDTAVICQGQSYLLPGGRTVKVSGTYYDTVKKPGNCDSIFITSLSVIPPVPDVVRVAVCSGQSYTLPGGVKVKTAGTYSDTLKTGASCDSVITTILTVFPNTFKVSLPVTDTILSGSAVALLPQYTGGTAIRWNWSPPFGLNCTDCEQPMAMPEQSTTYLVTATTSDGCQDTAQTQLVVRTSEVYIPTAFSPNNDGLHDRLDVFAMSAKTFHIRIYNRWGEIVFESQDMQQKWDGTFKGDICPTDQYVYVVDVVWQNDKAYHKQGMVMLLR